MNTANASTARQFRLVDRIWFGLSVATLITWYVAERGDGGWLLAVFVFALVLVKGGFVALDFMELRHAPAFWRWLVVGWLLVVVSLILFAYLNASGPIA